MKVVVEHSWYKMKYAEENDAAQSQDNGENKDGEKKEDDGIVAKTMKMAYNAAKNKLVSLLTGNQVLNSIGTVLDVLGFLHVIDREEADKKLKGVSNLMKSGVDNMDELLSKVPLLEDIFGSEKDTLKNVLKFMIFAQQVSIGAYPAEKYNIAHVVTVQSTLLAIIILNIITGGTLITATFGIGLDLMCSAYNKVYGLVEEDIDEFEKWMEENNMDGAKLKKDLENGAVKKGNDNKGNEKEDGGEDAKQAAESTLKDVKWQRIDENLVTGLVKAGVKAVGKMLGKGAAKAGAKAAAKGAAKTAAKGAAKQAAKTTTGKLAGKLAPQVVKAGRKIAAASLKQLRKSSPGFARFVKNGGQSVLKACSKNGITVTVALQTIGDFLQQSYETATEEDKKVIDVMKEELKSEKTTEEIKNKLEAMFAVIVDDAVGSGEEGEEPQDSGDQGQENAAESTMRNASDEWVVLN